MFSSTRKFVIYSYAFSHGLLLFRSRKTKTNPTRVDVLFKDVRALEIRMWFDGIEISETSLERLPELATNPRLMCEPGNKFYELKGEGWRGYILAGIMRMDEGEGEEFGPSRLLL